MRVTEKKPGEEVSLEFVLAGLAGENDHEGETHFMEDGFLDGKGNAALIGTESYAARISPIDGITADGAADTESEG
jgi:hypothetical protein